MILVFNKIDLIPASILTKWKEYFSKRFPLIKVIDFSVYPSNVNKEKEEENEDEGQEINLKQQSKKYRKEWKTRTRKYSSPIFSSTLIQKCLQELGRTDLFDEKFEQELLKQEENAENDRENDNSDDESQETDDDGDEDQQDPKKKKKKMNRKKNNFDNNSKSSEQIKLDPNIEKEEEEHNKKDLKDKPFVTIGLVVTKQIFFFFLKQILLFKGHPNA
jgi:ribosome biogenesis GTPase A